MWSEAAGRQTVHEKAARHHARLAALDQDLVLADPGPGLMFDDRVYKRGALTLYALRRRMGESAFAALLREWASAGAGDSVTTADFRALVVRLAGADIDALLTAWLDRPELPPMPR
jgi:aminopeptidase N